MTEREREVMSLVAEGLSNEEIARALFVSPATAKTHVSRAMVKLHARDRAPSSSSTPTSPASPAPASSGAGRP